MSKGTCRLSVSGSVALTERLVQRAADASEAICIHFRCLNSSVYMHSAVQTAFMAVLLLCMSVKQRPKPILSYPRRLCRPAWVGFSSPSVCLCVCLFVRSITQKRKIPKCSNLVRGMTLGYPISGTVLGFKGQMSRSRGQ